MNTVRTGVIGIGNMGTAHASWISDGLVRGMTLSAVCDTDAARRDFCRGRFQNVPCFSDPYELISSGTVDAVIIAVPHPMHAELASAALKNDLHVLTEKPVDVSVSKAKKLGEIARASDRVFGIMFNQRTDPLFARAREIVRSGGIGELIRSVWVVTNWYRTGAYYGSGSWRATWKGEGGGVLLNQAPHNLDLWQWICGMPVKLSAQCDIGRHHSIEVEDDATLLVRYKNGAVGTFITSTGEYPGTNRLEISGDRGRILLEDGRLKYWKLKKSIREVSLESDENSPAIPYDYEEFVPEAEGKGHVGILENFAEAVLFGKELLAPGTDGIHELMLSNAAYLSSWKGGEWLTLPIDGDEFDKMLNQRIDASSLHETKTKKSEGTDHSARWKVKW